MPIRRRGYPLLGAPGRRDRVLYEDRFQGTAAAGSLAGTTRGRLTITDAEATVGLLGGRLRGFAQTTPVWGDEKIVDTVGWPRAAGRAFAVCLSLDDFGSDFAVGLATSNPGDPRTNGIGWLVENGALKAITPGLAVVLDAGQRAIRSSEYLAVVALNDVGGYVLLSTMALDSGSVNLDGRGDLVDIPAWPNARLLWVEKTDATATLLPYASGFDAGGGTPYPNGHALRGWRVVDVAAWATPDALAAAADRFTRSNGAIGGGWTQVAGTWTISTNRALCTTTTGFNIATLPTTLANGDGIWECDITVPSGFTGANASFGMVLRFQDSSNFIRVWNNNAQQIVVQTWVAGAFGATIFSTAHTWTAGQTYRLTVLTRGANYHVLIDGVSKSAGAWSNDANNRFLSSTTGGLYDAGSAVQAADGFWDNFKVWPHRVALPPVIARGARPNPWVAGGTLTSDTFSGGSATMNARTPDGGGPNWATVAGKGSWDVNGSGQARCTADGGDGNGTNVVLQNLGAGVQNVEQTLLINPAATLVNANNTTDGSIRSGVVLRSDSNAQNAIVVRCFKDLSQFNSDEIELQEIIAGAANIRHKVNVGLGGGPRYVANTPFMLRVQVWDDKVVVLLGTNTGDLMPRIVHYMTNPATFQGTYYGVYQNKLADFASGPAGTPADATSCIFDSYTVKSLT